MSNNGRRTKRFTTMSGLISERGTFEPVVSAFRELHDCFSVQRLPIVAVCTENLIRVDDVMESPKLAE